MKVQVKLFAAARDAMGEEELSVELTDSNADVAALRKRIRQQFPPLAPLLPHIVFAVDTEYAPDHTPLTSESEVACIPPVSGG